jgi:hypothetical protein
MTTKELNIWYEVHPVTPERKAELRAAGYKVVDAVFKPDGHHDQSADSDSRGSSGDGKITAADLKALLSAAGVTFKSNASKPELHALLNAFYRSALTGAEWNNLAEEDRANRVSR